MSSLDVALAQATLADLERIYRRLDLTQEHYTWPGAVGGGSGVVSISGLQVPVHRVLLYGLTGVLFARSRKLCTGNLCVRPDHWEWDRNSARIERPERLSDDQDTLYPQLVALGLLARKFRRSA